MYLLLLPLCNILEYYLGYLDVGGINDFLCENAKGLWDAHLEHHGIKAACKEERANH